MHKAPVGQSLDLTECQGLCLIREGCAVSVRVYEGRRPYVKTVNTASRGISLLRLRNTLGHR